MIRKGLIPGVLVIAVFAVPLLAACAAPAQKKPPPTFTSQLIADGYRRVVKDGQELYCREDNVLGTRVARGEVCHTVAQLENMRRGSDEMMRGINNSGVGPPPSNQALAPR
jgi:hypothetical protein